MFSCCSEAMNRASRSNRSANWGSTAMEDLSALIATVRPRGSWIAL